MTADQLRRIRWAVRATLALGVIASTVANVLHAEPNPISQTIAAWPPVALLVTIELISRVPVHGRALAVVRLVATTTIAGIAAWVSYWHMAGVIARYGETGAAPYLIPLSVDGLVVVASVSLVELAGHIRAVELDPARSVVPTAVETPTAVRPVRPARTRPTARATDRGPGDPLAEVARTVAVELTSSGRRITRDGLAAGLRARGHSVATDRAAHLARTLAAASS